jgi:hypothetical protein
MLVTAKSWQSKPVGDKGELMPSRQVLPLTVRRVCRCLLDSSSFGAVERGDKGYIQGRLGLSRDYDWSMAAWAKEPISRKIKHLLSPCSESQRTNAGALVPYPHISLGLGTSQNTVS